jgi:nucleotide-binding universal stress UspA family protein
MPKLDSIFLATDFSPCARYAEDYTAALAKRLGAEVHVGHVVDTGYLTYTALYGQAIVVDANVAGVEQAAREHLDASVARLQAKDLKAAGHFARGVPIAEMKKMIAQSGAKIVVTGTHGHSGFNKFLFGSFCEKLLRQSPTPVLAIKQPGPKAEFDEQEFALERLACTTDLSEVSRGAFAPAAALAIVLKAELILLHVVDTRFDTFPYVEAMERPSHAHLRERAEQLLGEWSKGLGVARVRVQVTEGVPHERIDAFVRDHNIDLLVIATHGHGGVAHALLGSTAERVVRTAACPVLSVRPS